MSGDLGGLVERLAVCDSNRLRSTLGKIEVALGAIEDAIVWTGNDNCRSSNL